jgi:hypothetical protein
MKSNITRIGIGFLITFAVLCAAVVAFQAYFIWPANRCEAMGDWWDPQDHVCAVPMPISQFTGRKIGGKEVVTAKPAAH